VIVQWEGDKIPVMGHLIPVIGAKIPCSPGAGISREMPEAHGLLYFEVTSCEELPVNFPDTRENKEGGH
jgi:hypothetical protein